MIYDKKRPILYVDDTVEQRYAMRRILETENFVVVEAGTAKEALELMQTGPILAVVDVRLPDMDGYELCRRMKEADPYLPILQVSASFNDPDLRAAGLSGGADAYIAQPVHPAELTALTGRMLRASEAEESLRFLASIGPRLSATLSVPNMIRCIQDLVTPRFADRCFVYLRNYAAEPASFFPEESSLDEEAKSLMLSQAGSQIAMMVSDNFLIAPLAAEQPGFGSIGFQLASDRAYRRTDMSLALDLANRFGLALQNSILFASREATRSALIQAEKLATAGRMSAAIAHEINNPLEALTNLIYILERSPEATDGIREIATSALSEVSRLAHITRQTLGFYKELRSPSNLNLAQSIRETVELYRKRLDAKRVDLTLDLDESLEIRGIKGEIRQVLSNLLVNALEAVEEEGKVTVLTQTREGEAVIVIRDDGVGIPESLQTQIFEPFFTTKQGTGTGLGLWITKTIVEKHEGTIALTSRADRGTEFRIMFPLEVSSLQSQ